MVQAELFRCSEADASDIAGRSRIDDGAGPSVSSSQISVQFLHQRRDGDDQRLSIQTWQ